MEVAGNSGPVTATSSIPGVRAEGHWAERGGSAAFWHSRADPVQCPSRESEVRGESLISQEATLVKPAVRLSTLCLKAQPATAVYPLISYPGKILPLESAEYRFFKMYF